MTRFFAPILILFLFIQCQTPPRRIKGADPDILLVNTENGDRTFMAKILSKIDSLKPVVVEIDVLLKQPRHKTRLFLSRRFK